MRTVVIPHAGSVRTTQWVFRIARRSADVYARIDGSPRRTHKALQVTLAGGLLALPIVWLTAAVFGYTLMFKSLGASSWRNAYDFAGSAMFTLGFAKPDDLPKHTLSFTAAALAQAQNLGQPMPALEAVKWYNTPPLAMEQLQDKAILVEVFRTW